MKQVKNIIDNSKNKIFVLALILFVYFTTFQISNSSNEFKSSSDFYTFFLAIGALIALVKTFLISYRVVLDKFFVDSQSFLVLINIFFSSGIIWLMNSAVISLTQSSYPRDYFALLSISTGIYLIINFLNEIGQTTKMIIFSLIYYVIIYVFLWQQQLVGSSVLFFQITSAAVILCEFLQINQIVRLTNSDK